MFLNDIALLKLKTPFIGFPPVTLKLEASPSEGDELIVMGRGLTEAKKQATQLLAVERKLLSPKTCASTFQGYNEATSLCVDGSNGKSAAQGKSCMRFASFS
jgi:hypothetical protein